MKKQHYMTHDERQQLEALSRAKIPVAQIARQLGFSRQTIYNELKIGSYTHTVRWWDEIRYSAAKAEEKHRYNQTAKGRPLKIGNDQTYADRLEELMLSKEDRRKRYSPAAAIAQAKAEGYETTVCVTTLYSYIDKRIFRTLTNKNLWEKAKKKTQDKDPVKRIAHPKLPNISNRPDYINSREEPGHWEMDLVVSCKGGAGVILTLTERISRREIIMKLPNRKAETIRKALDKIEAKTPDFKKKFKSITTDNGAEFLEYDKLIQSIYGGTRFDIYYCHSYAAYEKGTNENHNRMFRRWFPKGTDFSKITKKELAACETWMNNYPRKKLDWLTPNQFYRIAA